MNAIQLTPTQTAVLVHALDHADGRVNWFPDTIKGGARERVIEGLAKRHLVRKVRGAWIVAEEGIQALGRSKPDQETADAVAIAEAAVVGSADQPRARDNSKQAQVIAMLKRPEGATIAQICEVTGWLPHTVRGTFAGTFKKRLGLAISSDKIRGDERVYRVVT
jgi:hypothetical protein